MVPPIDEPTDDAPPDPGWLDWLKEDLRDEAIDIGLMYRPDHVPIND